MSTPVPEGSGDSVGGYVGLVYQWIQPTPSLELEVKGVTLLRGVLQAQAHGRP